MQPTTAIPQVGPAVVGESLYFNGVEQIVDSRYTTEIVKTPIEMFVFLSELFSSFPESSVSLSCVKWKYDKFLFEFIDYEENKRHTVDYPMALHGFGLFWKDRVQTGKFPGDPWDAGNWDSDQLDMLLQLSVFSEIIYG